jgi:methylglutaconyl-CoA hydratase
MGSLILKKFDAGVLHISLNNPDKSNAMTQEMIHDLTDIFRAIKKVEGARVIVIRGEGKSFCAGVDLRHIEDIADFSQHEHKKEVKALSDLFEAIVSCPLPVIAIGHGNVFGAGIGLLAAADIAVAFEATSFCFSEVNLGLVPGIISPYVVSRIGLTHARRYFLSGEIFQWWDAKEMNLVNYVGTKMACFEFLNTIITQLKKGAPGAQAETKKLLDIYTGHAKRPSNLPAHLVDLAAKRRFSEEGHEGIHAFLHKREPAWRK